MNKPIERLLSFELVGPIAQFRKFYSNISALSYEIPPRTVVAGIFASIMELPRDSYYEVFSPSQSKMAVQLLTGVRKYMAYTNYRNPNKGSTIQTRVELLFPVPEYQNIRYRVFCWHATEEVFNQLYERLINGNAGYGVYMGQRQFRASIRKVKKYNSSDLNWKNSYEGVLSTATCSNNVVTLENKAGHDIISSSMPLQMQQVKDGREPIKNSEMVYEITGQGIKGQFKEALEVVGSAIAFMSLFDN